MAGPFEKTNTLREDNSPIQRIKELREKENRLSNSVSVDPYYEVDEMLADILDDLKKVHDVDAKVNILMKMVLKHRREIRNLGQTISYTNNRLYTLSAYVEALIEIQLSKEGEEL